MENSNDAVDKIMAVKTECGCNSCQFVLNLRKLRVLIDLKMMLEEDSVSSIDTKKAVIEHL